jgi:hypothetical protein
MTKHKHISRVKTANTDGWQVRLQRRKQSHSKFFPIRKYASEQAALEAAIRYRDTLVAMAPPPLPAANAVKMSGEAGLIYYKNEQSWQAQWVDGDGKRRSRRFSENKYGKLRAKLLAKDARMRGVARLDQVNQD